MASFIVLSPQGKSAFDPGNRFVRDGFSWGALLVPTLWAIAHGVYLDAIVLIALRFVAFLLLADAGTDGFGVAVFLATNIIYAFEAKSRWGARLSAKDWIWQGTVTAHDIGEAEALYYANATEELSPETINGFKPNGNARQAPALKQNLSFGLINIEEGRR
jgi:hypothetical protein